MKFEVRMTESTHQIVHADRTYVQSGALVFVTNVPADIKGLKGKATYGGEREVARFREWIGYMELKDGKKSS